MKKFTVYSYPKFGDHCVCFGIIREFTKHHDKILYYSDEMSDVDFNNCVRLYSSIKNVELIREPYNESQFYRDWGIANTKYWFDTVLPWIKDPNLPLPDWFDESWIFDRQWYMNVGIPFNKKWDNFYFERDLSKEKEIFYDILGLKDGEDFIFIHEDPERNFILNKSLIDSDIKIIDFNKYKNISILDILYTVEKSKEVHVYNTGILTFIDLMNIQHQNLYYHKYVRPWTFDQVGLRLNWKIYE